MSSAMVRSLFPEITEELFGDNVYVDKFVSFWVLLPSIDFHGKAMEFDAHHDCAQA